MTIYWKADTHGDPIGAIQLFLNRVWEQQHLDGFLVFSDGSTASHLIQDPLELKNLNPFQPLMRENLAGRIRNSLASHPEYHIGVILRPCEMRTITEMSSMHSFPAERLTIFCVDCLGTFPEDEYHWRVSRKSSHDQLANEALQYARQGGILAYRYRAACQICSNPGAKNANINLHVLGLPIRKQVLVETAVGETNSQLDLEKLSDGRAEDGLIEQFEQMLAKQVDYHQQTTQRVIQALGDLLPRDLQALCAELESCQNCQNCMEICPLNVFELPKRDHFGHYPPAPIQRWMLSCTGCGMCEQTCKRNLPLSVIFRSIKEKLLLEIG